MTTPRCIPTPLKRASARRRLLDVILWVTDRKERWIAGLTRVTDDFLDWAYEKAYDR